MECTSSPSTYSVSNIYKGHGPTKYRVLAEVFIISAGRHPIKSRSTHYAKILSRLLAIMRGNERLGVSASPERRLRLRLSKRRP